jgi:hypothetical protein
LEPVATEAGKLDPAGGVAHLSGRAAPSAADLTALKQFVGNGGVLVVDLCDDALLKAVAGEKRGRFLTAEDILARPTYSGMEALGPVRLRTFAQATMKPAEAVEVIEVGRGLLVQSPGDITSGFLGTNTWGITGLEPAYSRRLMKNLLIWCENQATTRRR